MDEPAPGVRERKWKKGHEGDRPRSSTTDRNATKIEFVQQRDVIRVWSHIIAFALVTVALVTWADVTLPHSKSSDEAGPTQFSGERAMGVLRDITALGPRVVGSKNNEKLTPEILQQYVEGFVEEKREDINIEVSVTTASGSFYLDFLEGFTNVYNGVQNIAVRVSTDENASGPSLLISAHYDTAACSEGASDDAINIAAMVEAVGVLSRSEPLDYPVIFLFGGAEESILQNSHGFVTNHDWVDSIRAFVNLEAAGSGAREILFQAGPRNSWMVDAYASSAPYPHGSVVASDVFQSGIIPSDTDYRIYRDYGELPGMDLAFYQNGYVYHTRLDTFERIPAGSMQRLGDNLVHTIQAMTASSGFASSEYDHLHPVYFDFLGLYMVHFSTDFLWWISLVPSVLVPLYIYLSLPRWKLMECLKLFAPSLAGAVLPPLLIAILLMSIGKTLLWYAHPAAIVGVFLAPSISGLLYVHARWSNKMFAKPRLVLPEDIYLSSISVWYVIFRWMMWHQVGSAYIALNWVFWPCLGDFIAKNGTPSSYNKVPAKLRQKHFNIRLVSLFIPLVLSLQVMWTTLHMFLPLMGRMGEIVPGDAVIAVLLGVLVYFVLLVPLSLAHNSPQGVAVAQRLFAGVSAVSLVVLVLFFFPYSGERPQRMYTQHVRRRFVATGEQDSGIWVTSVDWNSFRRLSEAVPEIEENWKTRNDCSPPYCQMPYMFPVKNIVTSRTYVPAPPPKVPLHMDLPGRPEPGTLTWTTTIEGGGRVIELTGECPTHCTMYMEPIPEALVGWSFTDELPPNDDSYFVFYATGNGEPLRATIRMNDLETPLSIALASHILEDGETKEIENLRKSLPHWVSVSGWISLWNLYEVK